MAEERLDIIKERKIGVRDREFERALTDCLHYGEKMSLDDAMRMAERMVKWLRLNT